MRRKIIKDSFQESDMPRSERQVELLCEVSRFYIYPKWWELEPYWVILETFQGILHFTPVRIQWPTLCFREKECFLTEHLLSNRRLDTMKQGNHDMFVKVVFKQDMIIAWPAR